MKDALTVLVRFVKGAVISAVTMAFICALVINIFLLPRLDAMLANAMRRELSMSDEAVVLIHRGSLKQTLRGFLPFSLVDSHTAIFDDIPVEKVRFKAIDIDFNMNRILRGDKAEISSFDAAELSLRISAQALRPRLTAALEKQGLKDADIEFARDFVRVTAENEAQARLSAAGRFYPTADNRVGFSLEEVELDLIDIQVSNLVLPVEDVFPPLDLGGMFAKVAVDEITVDNDYIEISAHAEGLAEYLDHDGAIEVF